MQKILTTVLERIHPERNIFSVVGDMIRRLQSAADAQDISCSVMLGGSLAKGTHLRGDHDADVFVRFDASYPDIELSEYLKRIVDAAGLDAERVHGSRDYFQAVKDDITYEIVPVLLIDTPSQARNVTDCSVLHVRWVLDRCKREVDGVPLNDHIRIAKAFCKAQRLYGAESHIGGFSGHILDILVIHYGGFLALCQAAKTWHEHIIIDPEQHYDDPGAVRDGLLESKRLSPLILIDPIDAQRNAAAALTSERFHRFIAVTQQFLADPDIGMFESQPLETNSWRYPADEVVEVRMYPIEGKRDAAGGKMRSAADRLIAELQRVGFVIDDTEFWWDGDIANPAVLLLHPVSKHIDATYVHMGPPVNKSKAAAAFKAKHVDAYEEDGRLKVELSRAYTDIAQAIMGLCTDTQIARRVSDIDVNA